MSKMEHKTVKRRFGEGWLTSSNPIFRALGKLINKTRKKYSKPDGEPEILYGIKMSDSTLTMTKYPYVTKYQITKFKYSGGEYYEVVEFRKAGQGKSYQFTTEQYNELVRDINMSVDQEYRSYDPYQGNPLKQSGYDLINDFLDKTSKVEVESKDLMYNYKLVLYNYYGHYGQQTKTHKYGIEVVLDKNPVNMLHFYCNDKTVKEKLREYYTRVRAVASPIGYTKLVPIVKAILEGFFKSELTLYAIFSRSSESHSNNLRKPGHPDYDGFVNMFNLLPYHDKHLSPIFDKLLLPLRIALENAGVHYYSTQYGAIKDRVVHDLNINIIDSNTIEVLPDDQKRPDALKKDIENILKPSEKMRFNKFHFYSTPGKL